MNEATPHATTGAQTGVRMEFRSCPTNLAAVRGCVENLAASAGFDAEWRFRITLAVDEALANVIRHGYCDRRDGSIRMTVSVPAGGGIRIEIEDECPAVDPSAIPSRDLDEIRPGGLGWHIIRETFERADWNPRGDCGMSLVLERGPQPAALPVPPSSP